MKVTIEEYIPEEEKPFIDIKDGKLWSDIFYDPKRQMYFHVMKEPDWIHFEFYKTYEINFHSDDDCIDSYNYRLAARLIDNTLIVSEFYDNKWYTLKEDYIPDDVKRIDLFEYIDEHSNRVSWSDPSLKYIQGVKE